ncbi:hypothetical protein Sjap_002524 [Stephania japonica]|uniref:GDSL esterase/lipase n=1 Tax=Stephania japonica TaxID=461633 RepID=A0AAP0KNT2_9MAGN
MGVCGSTDLEVYPKNYVRSLISKRLRHAINSEKFYSQGKDFEAGILKIYVLAKGSSGHIRKVTKCKSFYEQEQEVRRFWAVTSEFVAVAPRVLDYKVVNLPRVEYGVDEGEGGGCGHQKRQNSLLELWVSTQLDGFFRNQDTGSSDFLQNYYIDPLVRAAFSIDQFSDILMRSFATFVQKLYKLGARRIGVTNLPPLGCLPAAITMFGAGSNQCVKYLNQDAATFNRKLNATAQKLKCQLPGVKIVVFDIYQPLLDLVTKPSLSGFFETRKACCGTGTIETSLLCNSMSIGTCANATEYVFWDGVHPSESANKIMATDLMLFSLTTCVLNPVSTQDSHRMPWSASVIWRNLRDNWEIFKTGVTWGVGNGNGTHFWSDRWLEGTGVLQDHVFIPPNEHNIDDKRLKFQLARQRELSDVHTHVTVNQSILTE